jgi:hypothetical protein
MPQRLALARGSRGSRKNSKLAPRICLIGYSLKHESPAREARALTRNADFKRRELV